jgi:hypothetical protein
MKVSPPTPPPNPLPLAAVLLEDICVRFGGGGGGDFLLSIAPPHPTTHIHYLPVTGPRTSVARWLNSRPHFTNEAALKSFWP